MKKNFKTIWAILFTFFVSFNSRIVFAVEDAENPDLSEITHPVFAVLNLLLMGGGVFFIIYVFIAVVKFAMAQGDPKSIQGAKQTLTFAIYGFVVILGSFALLGIVAGAIGAGDASPLNLKSAIESTLGELLALVGYISGD